MTAYVEGNPKTKKELRSLLSSGSPVRIFSPGPFPVQKDGTEFLSGPHHPAPHTWYAKVKVEDGVITKILS